jgi:hypothetical protein
LAKNICQCPNPPGGQATCNEDQLAICRVVNNVAHTECIDAPDDLGSFSSTEGKNWILSKVLQVQRSPFQPVDQAENDILSRGRYRVPETADVVHFKIPVGSRRGRPVGA